MPQSKKNRPEKATILVPGFSIDTIDTVLYYAVPVAKVFGASISFLIMGDDFLLNLFKENLNKKASGLIDDGSIKLIPYSSSFVYTPVIEKNDDDEEAIMVIFPQMPLGNFIKEMKFMLHVRKLRLPYMILQPENADKKWKSQTVIVPVGFRRTDKEAAIWASYFARFNNSKIIILFAKEKDAVADRDTRMNVRFMLNLFQDLKITPEVVAGKSSSGKLHNEAVIMANEQENSLVLITSTKHYGIEHYVFGSMELQTIKNKQKIPVLCVNPRKDLYVLCR